ncbi:MAG: tyrosine--tRNA ligase, partial [Firmicutes bacterium]|nr:tyrosine--tRNA ligase [Bacillota bacterium]
EEAEKAQQAAKALFGGGAMGGSVPTTEISKADFGDGLQIIELLEKCGLIPSRGEGRRLVQQGGVKVKEEKVPSIDFVVTPDMFENDVIMIQKGKKVFHQVKLV